MEVVLEVIKIVGLVLGGGASGVVAMWLRDRRHARVTEAEAHKQANKDRKDDATWFADNYRQEIDRLNNVNEAKDATIRELHEEIRTTTESFKRKLARLEGHLDELQTKQVERARKLLEMESGRDGQEDGDQWQGESVS